jgi:hypothetical protein
LFGDEPEKGKSYDLFDSTHPPTGHKMKNEMKGATFAGHFFKNSRMKYETKPYVLGASVAQYKASQPAATTPSCRVSQRGKYKF